MHSIFLNKGERAESERLTTSTRMMWRITLVSAIRGGPSSQKLLLREAKLAQILLIRASIWLNLDQLRDG
jgi:hypothetical protein